MNIKSFLSKEPSLLHFHKDRLAQEQVLKADVKQSMATNARSLGRQVNVQDDVLDLRDRASSEQAKKAPLLGKEACSEKAETSVEAESKGALEQGSFEGYHLAPEDQAHMMAANHQSLRIIRESYDKMSEDSRKAMDEIRQIRAEANLHMSELWAKAREKRAASQANHFEAWLDIFCKASQY